MNNGRLITFPSKLHTCGISNTHPQSETTPTPPTLIGEELKKKLFKFIAKTTFFFVFAGHLTNFMRSQNETASRAEVFHLKTPATTRSLFYEQLQKKARKNSNFGERHTATLAFLMSQIPQRKKMSSSGMSEYRYCFNQLGSYDHAATKGLQKHTQITVKKIPRARKSKPSCHTNSTQRCFFC